jgi:hypothetical protein
MKQRHAIRALQAVILLSALVAALLGAADAPIHKFGMGKLAADNRAYLTQSMDKAVSGFLVLSGIKTALAVVEGSEVGLGFNIEIGDVVQSVYDYVDIAWKTALAGGTVILITRLLQQAVELIDHWFLVLAFGLALALVLARWVLPRRERLHRVARDAAFFAAVCAVVLYFVFPLSIAAAAAVSKKITGPLIAESQRSFESIRDEFSVDGLNRKIFGEDAAEEEGGLASLILRGRMTKIKQALQNQAAYFKDKTHGIAVWTLQMIAGYLFDAIIFPVIFFILIFVVAKGALLYLFEDRRQQALSDDLRAVSREVRQMAADL